MYTYLHEPRETATANRFRSSLVYCVFSGVEFRVSYRVCL
jgi:hypothetical protein